MTKKLNNKGFTLIEVIVSIAILSFVLIGISLLMSTSARTFNSVEANIALQEESQHAMQFIQERVIDTSRGVLTTTSADNPIDAGNVTFYSTKHTEQSDGSITATDSTFNFKLAGDSTGLIYTENGGTGTEVSENLKSIEFTLQVEDHPMFETDLFVVESIDVTMEFELRGRTYTSTQTIALRNRPAFSETSESDLKDKIDIIEKGEEETPDGG